MNTTENFENYLVSANGLKPQAKHKKISTSRRLIMETYMEETYREKFVSLKDQYYGDMTYGRISGLKTALFHMGYSFEVLDKISDEVKAIALKDFRKKNPIKRPVISDTQDDINEVNKANS